MVFYQQLTPLSLPDDPEIVRLRREAVEVYQRVLQQNSLLRGDHRDWARVTLVL